MIYSFLYVLVFSVALVLIQKLDLSIPPLFSLLVTACIATIYFNSININNLKEIYSHCFQYKKSWISIMVIVLVMWATTMLGPGMIGASLFNFIYFAWLGVLGLLVSQKIEENKYKIYFSLCLFLLIAINVYFELHHTLSVDTCVGVILALLGGTSSFIYFKQSQQLAKIAHLSATQILAVRFYFSIIVLALFLPKHQIQNHFTVLNLLYLILLAFFTLIIPLYFSQKALEKITSEQHAMINSSCPIVTAILQTIIFGDLKTEQMIVYFLYTLSIFGFYFIERNRKMLVIDNEK